MAAPMAMDIGHPENLVRHVLAPWWLFKSEAVIPCGNFSYTTCRKLEEYLTTNYIVLRR